MSFGPIVEVGIGLIFVYLLMGLIVSAFLEIVANVLQLRGEELEKGIKRLLEAGATGDLFEKVFGHALIKSTKTREKPSYIPSRNFALALVDVLTKGSQADVVKALEPYQPRADSKLREALDLFQREAKGDLNKLRESIATWYDDAMDRVSGAYKRRTQWFTLLAGLVLAVVLNVDSIGIASKLAQDETLRANVVAAAEAYRATHPTGPAAPAGPASGADAPQPPSAPPADGTPPPKPGEKAQLEVNSAPSFDNLDGQVSELLKLKLPIGWSGSVCDLTLVAWLSAILGWLITGLAASLGAPFWFDILNLFMNLRAAGPKPKKDKEPTGAAAQQPK